MTHILKLIEQSYTMYNTTKDERYKKIWYSLVAEFNRLYSKVYN
jgi:translation initiation factor 2 alpha subunit (eIF-2alpha)